MKQLLLLLTLFICSFLLSSCQTSSKEIELLDSVSEISISESKGYGGLNENYFITINQPEAILVFEEVLHIAKGQKQKVDVINSKPDYDFLIHYENGNTHGLHLLLGNSGEESVFMYIGHENMGYIISPEDTSKLRNLVDFQ